MIPLQFSVRMCREPNKQLDYGSERVKEKDNQPNNLISYNDHMCQGSVGISLK